jgi:hypothetical protein
MTTPLPDREVAEIRAFFEARNRTFLISEEAGAWEVMFPIKGYPSAPPYAVGRTPVEAARNALALWYDRPDLGGRTPQPMAR